MTHYYCSGGCKGSSSSPGVCEDKKCLKFKKPLIECNCEDGRESHSR